MSAAFWVLAPIMVLAALGVVLARKPVHSALFLAVVMISLAIQYAALDAPFLFAVQIVVYTGAIMMLFLFVLMLVGADVVESAKETIAGHRWIAVPAALLLAATLIIAVAQGAAGANQGLTEANAAGNIQGIADLIFSRYVVVFEVTSALLITAAIGAMVLSHVERTQPRQSQAELAAARVTAWRESGKLLGPDAAPGTLATSNSVETPALLPDGKELE